MTNNTKKLWQNSSLLFIAFQGACGTGKTTALEITSKALTDSGKFDIFDTVFEARKDGQLYDALVVKLKNENKTS